MFQHTRLDSFGKQHFETQKHLLHNETFNHQLDAFESVWCDHLVVRTSNDQWLKTLAKIKKNQYCESATKLVFSQSLIVDIHSSMTMLASENKTNEMVGWISMYMLIGCAICCHS